jgi:hypothetical protein
VGLPIAGVIEGFYGRPWTWEERGAVAVELARWGMTDFVYAPKDDPKHRAEWKVPYDDTELAGFAAFTEAGVLRLGYGVSPGLSIDPDSDDDRSALAAKVHQLLDAGVGLVVLCLDDIPFGGGPQGGAHGRLAAWLGDHLGERADLALVPTEYVGIRSTAYLDALAAGVPAEVPIGWTGDAVVNEAITVAQARRRADALGGRLPLVWDNVPVNDGLMAERLHLGPFWGRDPELVTPGSEAVAGWLANPMVQPRASLLPLASAAAWLRGEDPLDAWVAEADRRGWRTFAEACDGAVPTALVAAARDALARDRLGPGELEPLRRWFADAATAAAPGLEEECAGWIEQTRAEARVALDALDALERAVAPGGGSGDFDDITAVFVLGFRWKALQGASVSVMGPRLGFRPVLGQSHDGRWAVRRSSLVEGANAVDALCRLAFDALAWAADRI